MPAHGLRWAVWNLRTFSPSTDFSGETMSIQAIPTYPTSSGQSAPKSSRGDVVSEVDVETPWGVVSVITTRSVTTWASVVGSDVGGAGQVDRCVHAAVRGRSRQTFEWNQVAAHSGQAPIAIMLTSLRSPGCGARLSGTNPGAIGPDACRRPTIGAMTTLLACTTAVLASLLYAAACARAAGRKTARCQQTPAHS